MPNGSVLNFKKLENTTLGHISKNYNAYIFTEKPSSSRDNWDRYTKYIFREFENSTSSTNPSCMYKEIFYSASNYPSTEEFNPEEVKAWNEDIKNYLTAILNRYNIPIPQQI